VRPQPDDGPKGVHDDVAIRGGGELVLGPAEAFLRDRCGAHDRPASMVKERVQRQCEQRERIVDDGVEVSLISTVFAAEDADVEVPGAVAAEDRP